MPDLLPEFEIRDQAGKSRQYAGTVGTTPILVPAVAGDKLEIAIIRCPRQSPVTRSLLWSIDNVTYHQLSVGEFVGWEFRDNGAGAPITQLYLKGSVANVSYEMLVNFKEL